MDCQGVLFISFQKGKIKKKIISNAFAKILITSLIIIKVLITRIVNLQNY